MKLLTALMTLLLVVGCDPISRRHISLSLTPTPSTEALQREKISIDTKNSAVALEIVDRIIFSHGPDLHPVEDRLSDELVRYWRIYTEKVNPSSRYRRWIAVYVANSTLVVSFSEFGYIRSSKQVVQIADELYEAFCLELGEENVSYTH